MTKAIGVGLVGYGLAGRVFHGKLVHATEGMDVRGIVTANEVRQAQARTDFPDAAVYSDYESLLNDPNIDLVVIGTPHDTHAALAIAACERGKHVVVDKIMATSVREADAMIAAAETHGVLLSVFHNRRWDSDFLTVKGAHARGDFGDVYTIESSVINYRRPPEENALRWRQTAKHGGGPYHDWGAHLMDQALQLLGPDVEWVFANFQYRWPGVDVETAASCEMGFAGGVRYRVEVGHVFQIGRPRWYVCGSGGAMTIEGLDPQEGELKEGRVVGGTPRAAMPEAACRMVKDGSSAPVEIVPGDYTRYYANVRDAIIDGAPLAVTAESVRVVLRVMEAAVLSARTGEVVRLNEASARGGEVRA